MALDAFINNNLPDPVFSQPLCLGVFVSVPFFFRTFFFAYQVNDRIFLSEQFAQLGRFPPCPVISLRDPNALAVCG